MSRDSDLPLETPGVRAYNAADMDAEQVAQKRFAEQDKAWTGPKFIGLGAVTLLICITAIYLMSTVSGCSLQIVP